MKYLALALCTLCILQSCDNLPGIAGSGGKTTAPQLSSYIEAYKQLKTETPDILKAINAEQGNISSNSEFAAYEQIIKNAGFGNSGDFEAANKKIGVGYGYLRLVQKEESHQASQQGMDDLAKAIQESIDDPDVPEEKKAELREKLKEVENGKKTFESFNTNRVWAKGIVKFSQRIANVSISEDEADLIVKNEAALRKAYEGFPLPKMPEIPHIDIDEEEE